MNATLDNPNTAMTAPGQLRVIKRNGSVVSFDAEKISIAITKAFLAVEGQQASASSRVRDRIQELTERVVSTFKRRLPSGGTVHIEEIQDQVELALMRSGEHKVARDYVIYREQHAIMRQQSGAANHHPTLQVTDINGHKKPLDLGALEAAMQHAATGLEGIDVAAVIEETVKNLYDGVAEADIATTMMMATRTRIEQEPNYTYVTARLLREDLLKEGLSFLGLPLDTKEGDALPVYLQRGVELELLNPELLSFDVARLQAAIQPERSAQFTYLGLQTLYDRYFLHSNDVRFELPQLFFMRVAMGLAIQEDDREARAIEFYDLLSSFDYMASTPTLFNAGTLRPQLSSCYLTTVPDDLYGIYGAIQDNAMLSKWAGGLGNDWTPVRALGSYIKGTNGKSQGVVPFLKVANDTAVAVNQCFAPDSQLFTAHGLKAIKDVQVGDVVLGKSGTYRQVVDHMAYEQHDRMVQVDVKHSIQPIRVTAGHPLFAITGVPNAQANTRTLNWLEKGKVKADWVDAGQLQAGDYVAQVVPQEVLPVAGLTEADAYLYGVMLGDGHGSQDGHEWGVSGNPQQDRHLELVRNYLDERGIHFWETTRGDTYTQIRWATGAGVVRCGTTGRFVEAGAPTLPFSRDDLYSTTGEKHIAPRFAHLPKAQTLALVQGLIDTDGGVSRGKEIYFTTTSIHLAEGLRYQMLRLGVPVAGQYRERTNAHTATRSDGSTTRFDGVTKSFDLRIPAVAELAERVGCKAITKKNWIEWNGKIFSRVRSVESIRSTPFVYDLKVEGDVSYMTTAGLAHNGGKRKGAVCAYLETWHLDIEEFLELRKNTGDDRRRTHDMNTANWVPDLFMQRVIEDGEWTLFSPSDTPDLHDLTGLAFAARYAEYEQMCLDGQMRLFKKIKAQDLWRKMLSMLFETGHPWITFKDSCNLRSPQQHVGVVHSSNLCTEITLNTSADEIAVCNLGSINLVEHIKEGKLDTQKLQKTVQTAVRMLDNVIDINYYAVPQAKNSNLKHRPVGLGIMGFQDALYAMDIAYGSSDAVAFADRSMEVISYHAIHTSTELAVERGAYSTFKGSLWDQGILPLDSLDILAKSRPERMLDVDRSTTLDWDSLRAKVQQDGMRNSNVMAIAPTATISNICGVSQSIEPTFQNLYVKSNLSGEFTVINPYLVRALKARDLWDAVMVNDLKHFEGSVQKISRIPDDLKAIFATAFEVEPRWLVDAASRRQKWIDQAQSLNLYIAGASGKKLDITYKMAWLRGLKTTYYLRALGATSAEKSTITTGALNAVSAQTAPVAAAPTAAVEDDAFANAAPVPLACSIDNPDCEACQ